MSVPLYQAKAELFRTLGHPVRIRVLELLQDGPRPVSELLAAIGEELGVEQSNLSQQLAVLRRAGLVRSSREGAATRYELTSPEVVELLRSARSILRQVIDSQEGLLAELRQGATR